MELLILETIAVSVPGIRSALNSVIQGNGDQNSCGDPGMHTHMYTYARVPHTGAPLGRQVTDWAESLHGKPDLTG